jgi:hypothetical protein
MVLPLPGNSTKEQSFYEQQTQPVMPGSEWPGSSEGDPGSDSADYAGPADPKPFKINGGR